MDQANNSHLHALLERVARLAAAEGWSDQLNPVQRAALDYLSRANRFSRAPSHVAEYLATTRGTVSQTLKALERKGFVVEARSEADRRRTAYTPTEAGLAALAAAPGLQEAVAALPAGDRAQLAQGLGALLAALLAERDERRFGICRACRHNGMRDGAPYCMLLREPLGPDEPMQICHEYAA